MEKITNRSEIGLVSPIMNKANIKPFSNLIEVLNNFKNTSVIAIYSDVSNHIELDDTTCYIIHHKFHENFLHKITSFFFTQLKVTFRLISLKNIDTWIFYIGDGMLLPILTAKIFNKKVLLMLGGCVEKEISSHTTRLYKIVVWCKKVNLALVDNIILYSPGLISEWNLKKYEHKVLIAHKHFINISEFCPKADFDLRDNIIGYIGRLSIEKGVLNFLQSIPLVLQKTELTKVLIVGEGPLMNQIETYISKNNLKEYVELIGWVSHDQLPEYLNKLKLLVLPSSTEGLPNILLESMACGTPVLATSIGSIPDILDDEKTGFLINNNSVMCIEKDLFRALNYPNLNEISKNCRKLIESKFSYASTVSAFGNIFEEISN